MQPSCRKEYTRLGSELQTCLASVSSNLSAHLHHLHKFLTFQLYTSLVSQGIWDKCSLIIGKPRIGQVFFTPIQVVILRRISTIWGEQKTEFNSISFTKAHHSWTSEFIFYANLASRHNKIKETECSGDCGLIKHNMFFCFSLLICFNLLSLSQLNN